MHTRALNVFCLSTMLVLYGCHHVIPPGQVTAPPVTPPAQDIYTSSLTGVAFGSVVTTTTANGMPSTDNKPGGADQPIQAASSANGNELTLGCHSSQVTQSHAQATAAVQPQSVSTTRQFGFALSTTSFAKGGFWRGKTVGGFCRGSHNTVATADATASGRLDLTFSANGDVVDQLILRVADTTPQAAHLEVRDGQNHLLELHSVPGQSWVTTTLAEPGPYSVHAFISSSAANGGGGIATGQAASKFAVSVQSMRDALALGYGQPVTDAMTVPLPVFVSADAIGAALDTKLFTDQHRFYPCAKVDCTTDRADNIYLEMPHVSTSGGATVLDMHLSGSYRVFFIFGGGVSGTIRTMAVPIVEHDTLRLDAPVIDVATHNLILKYVSGRFEQRLVDQVKAVRIDLMPWLNAELAKAQEHFPINLGGACLLLVPAAAHVRSVEVVTKPPQGIIANFGVEVAKATGDDCQEGTASR